MARQRDYTKRLASAASIGSNRPKITYDYDRQAWIVDGKVAKCGHQAPMVGCYACQHAGEAV